MASIRPYITINGVSSTTKAGLIISELPPIVKAPKRVLQEAVDGRDGDIITDLGYGAYDKPLKIGLSGSYDVDSIIQYFNQEGVIIFSNEPDKYYRFNIYEQIDFNRLLRFKTADVNIHVQPFKYKVNESPVNATIGISPNSVTVTNAGNIYSKPLIKIVGAGAVALSINGTELLNIDLDELGETIFIDSETLNAYDTNGDFMNRQVVGNYDNIKLNTGANTVTVTGAITALQITRYSRWV